MGERFEQARALAEDLAARPGIGILPDSPQTPIFNLLIDRSPAGLEAARAQIASEDEVWMFDRMWPTDLPELTRIEIRVGRQMADFARGEIVALVHRMRMLAP